MRATPLHKQTGFFAVDTNQPYDGLDAATTTGMRCVFWAFVGACIGGAVVLTYLSTVI